MFDCLVRGGSLSRRFGGIGLIGLLAVAPVSLAAQTAEDFYRGKQITMIIYTAAGGTYDLYARLLSRHMGNHLAGNPRFVPKNMIGAGGITAARFIYVTAPKDGLTIGTIGRGLPFEPMLGGAQSLDFDPLKFTWIGSMNKESSLAVAWHTSPVKTAKDLFTHELLIAGTSAGSDSQIIPLALNGVLGTKFKVISGYTDMATAALAVERGEVAGLGYWGWVSLRTERGNWLTDKSVNILFQTALEPHPDLPNVPLATSLARDEQEKQSLELLLARDVLGRPFVAPPDIPADRTAALRQGFDASMKDPNLLADAQKINAEINPATAAEVEALLKRIMAYPPEVVERTRKAMGR